VLRLRSVIAAGTVAALPALVSAQFLGPAGPPADPNAQFEAASIKPFDASGSGPVRMMMAPGRMEASGVPARLLLRQALRVQDYQILNVPDWANTERYSIVAKAPDGASPAGMPTMMTNLLKDRFKMVTHSETRELPIFNLVLARPDGRLGPSLKPTSPECQAELKARLGGPGPGRAGGAAGPGGPGGPGAPGGPGGAAGFGRAGGPPPPPDFNQPSPCGSMRMGGGLANASGQQIAQLVTMLAQFSGRPVVDKTGLTGQYDFDLKWSPDPGQGAGPLGPPPPGAPAPQVDPDAPNLYTAVQEQLGLKLENAKGPVDVVVVDRFERPSLD
jgi:uncharacterized protein (TIGR03435 family)